MKYQPSRVQLGQGQNGGLVARLWSQTQRAVQSLSRASRAAFFRALLSVAEGWEMMIDAQTGEVLQKLSTIQSRR
ncbi:MAG: hypothetical protein OXC18_06970 [Desulfurellaceae bacterium]|nr:hypothetical protein [Desulfurellaceae bacterium]